MGKKELSRVYDKMKPDEEQKKRMLGQIMQNAGGLTDDKTDDDGREINVVTYTRKNHISVISKAAAAAACAGLVIFGGYSMLQKNSDILRPASDNEAPEVTEITAAETEEQAQKEANYDFPWTNDTVLTDSDKSYSTENSLFWTDNQNFLGSYNGELIYYEYTDETEIWYTPVSEIPNGNQYTLSCDGIVYDIKSGGGYIYLIGNNKVYIYKDSPDNYICSAETGGGWLLAPGNDASFYSIRETEETYILGRYSADDGKELAEVSFSELDNFTNMEDSVTSMYMSKSGYLAVGVSGKNDGPRVFIFNSDLDYCGYAELPDYSYVITVCDYRGGILLKASLNDNSDDSCCLNPETLEIYEVNDAEYDIWNISAGFGDYDAVIRDNDSYYGVIFEDGTKDLIAEYPSENGGMYLIEMDGKPCIFSLTNSHSSVFCSFNEESRELFRTDDFASSAVIDSEGNIRALSIENNQLQVYEYSIPSGELKKTELSDYDWLGIRNPVYTENYTGCMTVSADDEKTGIYTFYKNNGEETAQLADSFAYDAAFTVPERDVFVYLTVEDGEESWKMYNLASGETVEMDNSIPADYMYIFPGRGKYDFFFRAKDGFYGGIIDGTSFRYCRVVDFDRLTVDSPTDGLYIFFYEDENHIYIGNSPYGDNFYVLKEE